MLACLASCEQICKRRRARSLDACGDASHSPQGAQHAVFRSVNERISDLAISREDSPEELQSFVCECSQIGCTEIVRMPLSAYAQVRVDPTTYIVLPGHEDAEVEEMLVRLPEYVIVRDKTGVAAAIAQSTARG
jgi:hypothetical protein